MHDERATNPTNQSLWADAFGGSVASADAPPARADVVVVGAGLTGMLAAMLLQESGADVLVLDRDRVGGQATRNTTAKVSCLQGTVLSSIASSRGEEHAAAYAAANVHALDGIRSLVARLGIDCDLVDATAYTHAVTEEGLAGAAAEHDAARAAGLPVSWTDETDLPFEVLGAVRLDGQAHLHPVKLCRGLGERLGPRSLRTGTAVTEVEEHDDRCVVELADGHTLAADHVIVATQSPVVDPALLANRCHPEQSYALAARVGGPLAEGMYLSSDPETRSVRPATGPGGPVLVLGGSGHPVGDPETGPERWASIVDWATAHWGELEVTHRWATHDLVPSDHVPFIGRLAPGSQRRWVATGFQKWGMTNAYVAGHLIAEQIAGREVPWQETFDATRLKDSLTGELVSSGVRAARRMVGDRVEARLTKVDPSRLEPGSGAVTTVGGTPVAVHRGPDGLRAVSARCSHQGCLVGFDAAVQTWSCPCHGSRFDTEGRVIQGPAVADLDPVELPDD
jgi:glycine/D-amino acid oxidase-like deaminating enzyme/nitrite reductase/ring-hydroxylating ferredoxin subunit